MGKRDRDLQNKMKANDIIYKIDNGDRAFLQEIANNATISENIFEKHCLCCRKVTGSKRVLKTDALNWLLVEIWTIPDKKRRLTEIQSIRDSPVARRLAAAIPLPILSELSPEETPP